MDHGEKYWLKQSYEYQRDAIHFELYSLTELCEKDSHTVKLYMNRVIKYTFFSIKDPKNAAIKDDLQHMLIIAQEYKEHPDNLDLEKELLAFFGNKSEVEESEGDDESLCDFFDDLLDNTPETAISIIWNASMGKNQ